MQHFFYLLLYLAWTSNIAFPGIIFTDWTSHSTVTIANPPHWSASSLSSFYNTLLKKVVFYNVIVLLNVIKQKYDIY